MRFECKSPRCRDLDLNETDKVCWRCGGKPVPVSFGAEDIEDAKPAVAPVWLFGGFQTTPNPPIQGAYGNSTPPLPLPQFKPNSNLPIYDKVGDYEVSWLGWTNCPDLKIRGTWVGSKLDGAIKIYKSTAEIEEYSLFKEVEKSVTFNALVELLKSE